MKLEDGKTIERNDDKSVKSTSDALGSNTSTPFVQIPYQLQADSLTLGSTQEIQVSLWISDVFDFITVSTDILGT